MILKYKIKDGTCLTRCPNPPSQGMVNSVACTHCKYYVKNIYKSSEIECSYVDNKSSTKSKINKLNLVNI
jgi:hypothetical protein